MPRPKFLPLTQVFFAIFILIFHFNLLAQSFDYEQFLLDCSHDNVSAVEVFLKRGGNPNYASFTDGDTCLIKALREDNHKVSALIIADAKIQLNRKNRHGESALMLASFKGNLSAVQALLARGAVVNHEGWTALHYAVTNNQWAIAQLLLSAKAAVDALSPNQTTPLMMAARNGNIELVKLLLQRGANDTLKNTAGLSAEDFARQAGHAALADGFKERREKSAKNPQGSSKKSEFRVGD